MISSESTAWILSIRRDLLFIRDRPGSRAYGKNSEAKGRLTDAASSHTATMAHFDQHENPEKNEPFRDGWKFMRALLVIFSRILRRSKQCVNLYL